MIDYDEDNQKYPLWKLYLYQLQNEAPKPSAVFCQEKIENIPLQYGLEFHGILHRYNCQEFLKKEGNYLVRSNNCSGIFTLSLRCSGVVKHYKLYFDGQHFVGEKKFDKLEDLVSDGLVTLYLESKARKFLLQLPSSDYKQSPYFTLTRNTIKNLNKSKKVISDFKYKGNLVNNLSPIVDTPDQSVIPEGQEILEECLNIKFNNERMPSELLLFEKNTENSVQSLSREFIEISEVTVNDRSHHFHNHSFSGLHWCGFCGNFLWGFVLQGVKCSDCGMKAHRPCSLRIPNDCCPDLKNLKCIFGMDLSTSISTEELVSDDKIFIPFIVKKCISEIEARGLTKEGIYRVSGSHDQIDSLRLAFEREEKNVIIDEKAVPDINSIAGLLKLFFRLLPLRLITADCFRGLLEANQLSFLDERITATKEALGKLPLPHYHTLKFLIIHLGRVCEHNTINKMSATSLSTIFGPTLINVEPDNDQIQPEDLLALKLTAPEPRIIEMLIILQKDIFS